VTPATQAEPVRLVYFAWLRERVGLGEERVAVPPAVETVGDLIRWQRGRGDNYAYAFEAGDAVRAALDHIHARPEAPLAGAREIAFFPPMTGG